MATPYHGMAPSVHQHLGDICDYSTSSDFWPNSQSLALMGVYAMPAALFSPLATDRHRCHVLI